MKSVYIYALIDPRDSHVRYIGKANNPKERYNNHFNSSRDKNTYKRNWINSLRNDGYRPELLILDEVPIITWQYWEKFYISLFKSYGFKLVNYTLGGDGSTFGNKGSFKKGNIPHNKGVSQTDETKEKIRKSLLNTSNISSYKKIIQYDINYKELKRYNSIKDAVIENNGVFNASKISSCLTGRRLHHKGYIWKYDNNTDIIMINISLLRKKVIQYDKNLNLINEYDSIQDAEYKTNIKSSGICACCKSRVKTAGGYIWKYSN